MPELSNHLVNFGDSFETIFMVGAITSYDDVTGDIDNFLVERDSPQRVRLSADS
jgi:hypothetical protein